MASFRTESISYFSYSQLFTSPSLPPSVGTFWLAIKSNRKPSRLPSRMTFHVHNLRIPLERRFDILPHSLPKQIRYLTVAIDISIGSFETTATDPVLLKIHLDQLAFIVQDQPWDLSSTPERRITHEANSMRWLFCFFYLAFSIRAKRKSLSSKTFQVSLFVRWECSTSLRPWNRCWTEVEMVGGSIAGNGEPL